MLRRMARSSAAEGLERIIGAGVAITTRALAEARPDLDLTFPQWRATLVVGERPEGARVSEVAARVGVTVPATSRLLRRLAARGLLEISADESDRRASRARLTPDGRGARDAILAYRRLRIEETLRGTSLSGATRAELARLATAFDAHR
jgi:DNA-binding MarR family transcriptional regulator